MIRRIWGHWDTSVPEALLCLFTFVVVLAAIKFFLIGA